MVATEAGRDASPRRPRSGRATSAFTLLEMLVVVAIISVFVGVVGYGFLRGSGSATLGLQAGQSTLVALLTQARSHAILTGRDAAVLVNDNPNNADRYRRYLCVVARDASNTWQPIDVGVTLPPGVYIVPRTPLSADDVDGGTWTDFDSSALQLSEASLAIEAGPSNAEAWIGIGFTPRGTTTSGSGGGGVTGMIVLATGRPQAPGSTRPFIYTNANGVRGIAITLYGLTRMLNDARDFGS